MKSESICRPLRCAAAIATLLICHIGHAQSVVEYSTRFTPSEGINGDDIGYSIDVDNNLLVLGAVGRDEPASGSGAAYIYENANGAWTLRVKLAPASLGSLDRFGEQVAVSGSRIAVSAQNYAGTNNYGGGVWTYTYAEGAATFEDRVIPDDNARYDLYGRAMDLEGGVLVVGAPGHDENGPGSGAVYVFEHEIGRAHV